MFNLSQNFNRGICLIWFALIATALTFMPAQSICADPADGVRDTERYTTFNAEAHAAEVATEMVFAAMNNNAPQLNTNLAVYGVGIPVPSGNTYYQTNFGFFNPKTGATNDADIEFLSSTNNMASGGDVVGMNEFASSYRILSAAQSISGSVIVFNPAVAQLNVEFDQVPIFEFAIFYNGVMEFSDTATLVVNGPVHGNGNIYVGSPDNLSFNSLVTASGNISAPANAGYSSVTWTGKVIYNGAPVPGYLTNQTQINLLTSSNSFPITNAQQILYPPQPGESSAVSSQLYYNKAGMTIIISNNAYIVRLANSSGDPSPVVLVNTLNYLNTNAYWKNWISTTNTFNDFRENKTVDVTQIDVGKLTNWMATNLYIYGTANEGLSNKFDVVTNPLNIIYVLDLRPTNSSTLTAIRLTDGASLPAAGLTIATPNPMYIQGNYNCPNPAFLGTTNTTASVPASVACDALTLLSPNWQDSLDTFALNETATADTINVAILTGNVPSTGTGASQFSGGVGNLPRLLEDWSSVTLTLNTSLVCLFSSTWATGKFVLPGTYYYAPEARNFSFDQNYLNLAKMPPGTPLLPVGAKRTYQRFGATNSF